MRIDLEQVSFAYRRVRVLSDISIGLPDGALGLVIGPNGGGKTTLCKLLSKIVVPTSALRCEVGTPPPILLWQDLQLFPLTVEQNLRIVNPKLVEGLLAEFRLSHRRRQLAEHLSGGEQQRLALARAWASQSKAIIFDEPEKSIDAEAFDLIIDKIANAPGRTQVVVTHDYRVLSALASDHTPDVWLLQPSKAPSNAEDKGPSCLSGPFLLQRILQRPPSRFAAEFVGYENIYGVRAGMLSRLCAGQVGNLGVDDLIPAEHMDSSAQDEDWIVVPSPSISLHHSRVDKSVLVRWVGQQLSPGGHVTAKLEYRTAQTVVRFTKQLASSDSILGCRSPWLTFNPAMCIHLGDK